MQLCTMLASPGLCLGWRGVSALLPLALRCLVYAHLELRASLLSEEWVRGPCVCEWKAEASTDTFWHLLPRHSG